MVFYKCRPTNIIDPLNLLCHFGTVEEFANFQHFEQAIHHFALEERRRHPAACANLDAIQNDASVIAYSSRFKIWRRADVTRISSEEEETEVDVIFRDYQYSEQVSIDQLITSVPDWIRRHPSHAYRCALAGVKPIASTWVSRCIKFLNDILLDEVVDAEVVEQHLEHGIHVSVINIYTKTRNGLKSVSEQLVEQGLALYDGQPGKAAVPKFNLLDLALTPQQTPAMPPEPKVERDYEQETFCAGADTDMTAYGYSDLRVATADGLTNSGRETHDHESIQTMISEMKSGSDEQRNMPTFATDPNFPMAGSYLAPIGSGRRKPKKYEDNSCPDPAGFRRNASPAGSSGSDGKRRNPVAEGISPVDNKKKPGRRAVAPRFRLPGTEQFGQPPGDFAAGVSQKPHIQPPLHWTKRRFPVGNEHGDNNSGLGPNGRSGGVDAQWQPPVANQPRRLRSQRPPRQRGSDCDDWRKASRKIHNAESTTNQNAYASQENKGHHQGAQSSSEKSTDSVADASDQDHIEGVSHPHDVLGQEYPQDYSQDAGRAGCGEEYPDWNGKQMPSRWSDWPGGGQKDEGMEVAENDTQQVLEPPPPSSLDDFMPLVQDILKSAVAKNLTESAVTSQIRGLLYQGSWPEEQLALVEAVMTWAVQHRKPALVLPSVRALAEDNKDSFMYTALRDLQDDFIVNGEDVISEGTSLAELIAAIYVDASDWSTKLSRDMSDVIVELVQEWAVLGKQDPACSHESHSSQLAVYPKCLGVFLERAGLLLDDTRPMDAARILGDVTDTICYHQLSPDLRREYLSIITDHYARRLAVSTKTLTELQSKDSNTTSVARSNSQTQTNPAHTRDIGVETEHSDSHLGGDHLESRDKRGSRAFSRVQEMLEDLGLVDVLPLFVDNAIRDSALDADWADLKELLLECGVKAGHALDIKTYLANHRGNRSLTQQTSRSSLTSDDCSENTANHTSHNSQLGPNKHGSKASAHRDNTRLSPGAVKQHSTDTNGSRQARLETGRESEGIYSRQSSGDRQDSFASSENNELGREDTGRRLSREEPVRNHSTNAATTERKQSEKSVYERMDEKKETRDQDVKDNERKQQKNTQLEDKNERFASSDQASGHGFEPDQDRAQFRKREPPRAVNKGWLEGANHLRSERQPRGAAYRHEREYYDDRNNAGWRGGRQNGSPRGAAHSPQANRLRGPPKDGYYADRQFAVPPKDGYYGSNNYNYARHGYNNHGQLQPNPYLPPFDPSRPPPQVQGPQMNPQLFAPSDFAPRKTQKQAMLEDSFTPSFVLKQLSTDSGKETSASPRTPTPASTHPTSHHLSHKIAATFDAGEPAPSEFGPVPQKSPQVASGDAAPPATTQPKSPADYFTPTFYANNKSSSNAALPENSERRLSGGTDNSSEIKRRYNTGGFNTTVSDWLSANEKTDQSKKPDTMTPAIKGMNEWTDGEEKQQSESHTTQGKEERSTGGGLKLRNLDSGRYNHKDQTKTKSSTNSGGPRLTSTTYSLAAAAASQQTNDGTPTYHVNPAEYPSLSEAKAVKSVAPAVTTSATSLSTWSRPDKVPGGRTTNVRFSAQNRVCTWCGTNEHQSDDCPNKRKNLFF